MAADAETIERLKLLRDPFEPHQISKLPKGGVQLDYVGHAALTDRLLDVDPLWQWEPLAFTPEGLPLIDKEGGLWIKLTVCGITRLGYGDASGKNGTSATKERIGDALRNAAMRFGAALDLWHKGELHQEKQPLTVVSGGQDTSQADTTDPLASRRLLALNTFKQHFEPHLLHQWIPTNHILTDPATSKVKIGSTFAQMSEEDLEQVEIHMADPNAPVRKAEVTEVAS